MSERSETAYTFSAPRISVAENDARYDREGAYHRLDLYLRINTPGLQSTEYAAFNDWVDEMRAKADYRLSDVKHKLTSGIPSETASTPGVIFFRIAKRLDSQYALDRSVVRLNKRAYEKAKKKIRNKRELPYHYRVNALSRHSDALYDLERRELELARVSDPSEVHLLSDGIRLGIHAQAYANLATRLEAIRAGYVHDEMARANEE